MAWFFQIRPEIKKYIDSFKEPSDIPLEASYDFTFFENLYLEYRLNKKDHERRKILARLARQTFND